MYVGDVYCGQTNIHNIYSEYESIDHTNSWIKCTKIMCFFYKHYVLQPSGETFSPPSSPSLLSICTSHFVSRIGMQAYIIVIHTFIQVTDCGRTWERGGGRERGLWRPLGQPPPSTFIYMSASAGKRTRAFYHWTTDAEIDKMAHTNVCVHHHGHYNWRLTFPSWHTSDKA